METETIKTTVSEYERHLFVKPGSDMIGERIGEIETKFEVAYVHRHEGQRSDIKTENYNKNMKIKSGNTYKFAGKPKSLDKLYSSFSNLERKINLEKKIPIKPQ